MKIGVLPFIQAQSVFSTMSVVSQQKLAEYAKVRVFNAGDRIFSEGDPGFSMFAMVTGSIKVFQVSPQGKEVLVKILHDGEIFGEVIMFGASFYPATALALESSTLIELGKEGFFKLLEENDFRTDFIATIIAKLRYLGGRVYTLMAHDVEERFFRFILETWGDKSIYEIDIAKKDFALAIGTIPETFSRLIARLKDKKDISWEGTTLKIKESIKKYYLEDTQGDFNGFS